MGSQRFRAVIAAGPRDSAVITMPFDPDEVWGAKAGHPVGGTIDGGRIRARLLPAGSGWVLPLAPKRLLGMGIAIGDNVTVELAPEGPQRGDLADDRAAALAADPAAGAFFDTLAPQPGEHSRSLLAVPHAASPTAGTTARRRIPAGTRPGTARRSRHAGLTRACNSSPPS